MKLRPHCINHSVKQKPVGASQYSLNKYNKQEVANKNINEFI